MADYSPYQQKIIKRYYRNYDAIKLQRLSELTTELYLAEGRSAIASGIRSRRVSGSSNSPSRGSGISWRSADPALLVGILKELEGPGK